MAKLFIPATAEDFAASLRHRRRAEGISQLELASVVGNSQSEICQWEGGGRHLLPNLRQAMVWANALGFQVALVPFLTEVTS